MSIEIDTKKLEDLITAFDGAKQVKTKIGIFDATQASIGVVHEFGNSEVPKRSFLRTPLMEKLPAKLSSLRALNDNEIDGKCVTLLAEKMGELGKEVVREAFNTSGFGHWPRTEEGNKPLVKTGKLRDSVQVKIEGGKS